MCVCVFVCVCVCERERERSLRELTAVGEAGLRILSLSREFINRLDKTKEKKRNGTRRRNQEDRIKGLMSLHGGPSCKLPVSPGLPPAPPPTMQARPCRCGWHRAWPGHLRGSRHSHN